MKICLACSGGGHLTQILQLKEIYKNYDYFFITFRRIDTENLENAYYVEDPKRNPLKMAENFFQSLIILLKEKPDVVITTGAGVAVLPSYIAKMLGAKIIYIESFSRTENPSLTGRLLYPIADVFLVQWKKLLEKYGPKAKYEGSVF